MSQHASAPGQQPPTPVAVRWAAGLLAVYSLMVLVHVFTLSPRDSEFDAAMLRTAIGRSSGQQRWRGVWHGGVRGGDG